MTRQQLLALLAMAPLITQGVRKVKSRNSGPWSSKCGNPPAATSGSQHICTSYASKFHDGHEFWIRGFMGAPGKAHQGCYIYLYGTQNDFTPGKPHEPQLYAPFLTREMANEGYCAVQAEYGSNKISQFLNVPGNVRQKAEDIFGPHGPSALSVLACIPGCDCSRRTVVHGHSQGGMMASLAGVFSPWVDKIIIFSGGCHAGIINACDVVNRHEQLVVHPGAIVSSDSRPQIRVIGTQSDTVLGCGTLDPAPTSISQYQTMTGRACCESTRCDGDICENCLDSQGTGYFVITEQTMPARNDFNHNWFLQMDPVSEETEALRTWAGTYDVSRILYGNGSWFDSGYDTALQFNDDVKNSNAEYGWGASKRFLIS